MNALVDEDAGLVGRLFLAAKEVARLLKEKKVPRISDMFREAKQVGQFRLIACSAGLAVLYLTLSRPLRTN